MHTREVAVEDTQGTAAPGKTGGAGAGLARQSVGLAGVVFQSVTFMAPGGSIATSLAVAAAYAGGALPLSVLVTLVAALIVGASIGQLARHLPSAGSIYTYPAQGLHPYVGFLVGWGTRSSPDLSGRSLTC